MSSFTTNIYFFLFWRHMFPRKGSVTLKDFTQLTEKNINKIEEIINTGTNRWKVESILPGCITFASASGSRHIIISKPFRVYRNHLLDGEADRHPKIKRDLAYYLQKEGFDIHQT